MMFTDQKLSPPSRQPVATVIISDDENVIEKVQRRAKCKKCQLESCGKEPEGETENWI